MNAKKISPLKDARTKTVATVGPASGTQEKLSQLLHAGVDVFRINMAHGSRESHDTAVQNIRAASEATGLPAGILVDLAGPKIRLGQLTQDPMVLEDNQTVRFVRGIEATADDELTCIYEPLIDEVNAGEDILLGDGACHLTVTEKLADELVCTVIDGGEVRTRQGVNLPATQLSVPALGDIDKDNAAWAAGAGVEFVSLSFVRNANEVVQLKNLLAEHQSDAMVISKIEKREALLNLNEIIQATDGVMVARGDLGVEIPIEMTPGAQKKIIQLCHKHRKPVIVATQMLESMHNARRPTRAEVTDVANAILDGADACMLSGETAIGQYPVESVLMMNRIMTETEKSFVDKPPNVTAYSTEANDWGVASAVLFGTSHIAKRINAKMVVLASRESKAALYKSKQHDFIPTICMTDCPKVYRRMTLFWGVTPVMSQSRIEETKLRTFVDRWIAENTNLEKGDRFIIVTDTEVLHGIDECVMVSEVS